MESPGITGGAIGITLSCPKHGEFAPDENIRLSINGKTIGNYCFRCYNDLLAAHCTRLPEVSVQAEPVVPTTTAPERVWEYATKEQTAPAPEAPGAATD